jgi:Zinc carboxypeptidase
VGASLAGAAGTADVQPFPRTSKTLIATKAVQRDCTDRVLGRRAGVATTRWRAPKVGQLRARLAAAGGDWDLGVFDTQTGAPLTGSASYGSRELARTWITPGGSVTVQACRRTGRSSRARLALDFAEVKPPTAIHDVSLVNVNTGGEAGKRALEALGLDLADHGTEDSIPVVLHGAEDKRKLEESGYTYSTLVGDLIADELAQMKAEARATASSGPRARAAAAGVPSGRTSYRQYVDYQNDMKNLAAAHPGFVRQITLPIKSVEGRPIEGIEITPGVNRTDDGKPVYVVMGLHHAREWPSSEATIEFGFDLINGYGSNSRFTNLLDKARVVIIPVVNPDGFVETRRYDDSALNAPSTATLGPAILAGGAFSYRRKNCKDTIHNQQSAPCELKNGVDPNRNYGAQWGGPGTSNDPHDQTFRGLGPFSEPETESVRQYLSVLQPTMVVTNHTFTGLILRPPGTQFDPPTPDEAAMKSLGDAMAAETDYISQRGYELYDTAGTTDDWVYSALGAYVYTPEIGKRNFHPAYADAVIAEYDGRPRLDKDGNVVGKRGGLREAFTLAGEVAADPTHHSIIGGEAPGGLRLRIFRTLKTATSARFDDGSEGRPVELLDDKRETTLTVPSNGRYEWHTNPSTRPFESGELSYRMTCENDRGEVFEQRDAFVSRGQRVTQNFDCGGVTAATANACEVKLSGHPSRLARQGYVRRRVQCTDEGGPFSGRLVLRAKQGSGKSATRTITLASRSLKLSPGKRTLVKIKLSRSGRRYLARRGSRRLSVTLVALQARTDRPAATVAERQFRLNLGRRAR